MISPQWNKSWYHQRLDRMVCHDYPGTYGRDVTRFIMDEIELGARVALALDDPDQTWWNLIGNDLYDQDVRAGRI